METQDILSMLDQREARIKETMETLSQRAQEILNTITKLQGGLDEVNFLRAKFTEAKE